MKTFVVNNRRYEALPFDYNMQCFFEENNISIGDMRKKPNNTLRVYFSACSGLDPEDAGKEIEAHIIAGGTMEDVATALMNALEESDFFRALKETAEKAAAENQEENQKPSEVKESKGSKK